MELDNLIDEYYKINKVTENQLNYVNGLIKKLDPESQLEYKDLDIKKENISKIIKKLKSQILASNDQISLMKNLFQIEINENKKLTIKDVDEIISGPKKFKLWIKERPLISNDDWEFGWQYSKLCKDNKMYYLKFYDLMMLDFDSINNLDELLIRLKEFNFRFRIYKSHNGYHVFITSTKIRYNSQLVLELSTLLKADRYYSCFVYKTGFKVRLSKKLNRDEDKLYTYLMDTNIEIKENKECIELIKIHDKYIKYN